MKLPKCFKIKCDKNHPLWNNFITWIELSKNVVRINPYPGYVNIIINYKQENIGNLPKDVEITLEDWKKAVSELNWIVALKVRISVIVQ